MTGEVAISGLRLGLNPITLPYGPRDRVSLQSEARYGNLICHLVHKSKTYSLYNVRRTLVTKTFLFLCLNHINIPVQHMQAI